MRIVTYVADVNENNFNLNTFMMPVMRSIRGVYRVQVFRPFTAVINWVARQNDNCLNDLLVVLGGIKVLQLSVLHTDQSTFTYELIICIVLSANEDLLNVNL